MRAAGAAYWNRKLGMTSYARSKGVLNYDNSVWICQDTKEVISKTTHGGGP